MRKFKFTETKFKDLYIIEKFLFKDRRGELTKYYQSDIFNELNFQISDIYTTFSASNVIRGMHHQNEPHGQTKIISCLTGSFYDVAIDLRENSETYLKIFTYKLTHLSDESILVPSGFSHGIYTLEDKTLMLSICSGQYLPDYETGFNMHS